MARWSVPLLVAMTVLAGCSASSSGTSASTTDPASDVHVEATRTTGVIRGIVVDAAIRPLGGAQVTTQAGSTRLWTNTTPTGAFGFQGLAPGTYFVVAEKPGYKQTQTSVEVVAGDSMPRATQVQLEANPVTKPYVETLSFKGFLACGAAIFLTSVGCTTVGPAATATASQAIFGYTYTQLPMWMQGELIWDQTQAAGGELIWEAVIHNTNAHVGYRETTTSPALMYWNTTILKDHEEDVLKDGIDVRFFGGAHPSCKSPVQPELPSNPSGFTRPLFFGCGATLNQDVRIIVDTFYNFTPPTGWRHSKDGEAVVPA
ncbi:MAG TPA: carboxypeptidase-like regulatory domain-containing protein [Candidatus Thermoplasmatota archaeon]|nr:carboxypeptidase-like regulatory domain-containing protein [Candidatus Thermoplasmatota archaeon]